MIQLVCTRCSVPLSGGEDTFGETGVELCYPCHLSLMIESAVLPLIEDDDYSLMVEMEKSPTSSDGDVWALAPPLLCP